MTNSTDSLVPRTTGLPVRIFGSSAMREGLLVTWWALPYLRTSLAENPARCDLAISTSGALHRLSIHRAASGDRPELLDAVGTDANVPVIEVDGRVAMAGDEADLVAEPKPVGGGRDGEAAVLVGGALVGRGGLVADQRRAGIEAP